MTFFTVELEWISPSYWLIGCVALGILAALHLYFKKSHFPEIKPWQHLCMTVLRGLTVAILAALLLTPIIMLLNTQTEQKNIVFVQDNSASLRAVHDSTTLNDFNAEVSTLLNTLAGNVDTAHYIFDETIRRASATAFNGKTTNISNALQQVRELYPADRLSAIILASDGVYNEGQNPYYQLGLDRIPIYSIAMGDTTAGADSEIQRVFHNRVVYKGDEFEIEVDLGATGMKTQRSTVSISEQTNGKFQAITSTPVRIDKNDFFQTLKFKLKASKAGVNRYRVALRPLANEKNKANNYADFFVEVIESRQKILVLAHAPHPDLQAIKTALESLKNYDVEITYARNMLSGLKGYDLVVLHNLPSTKYPINTAFGEISRLGIPILFIVGKQTEIRNFNRQQVAVQIQQAQQQYTDAEPLINERFNLFSVNNEIRQFSLTLPPLAAPFGSFSTRAEYDVLFKQEIKNVETNYPLVLLGETDGKKTGVITGEGIWKWRMFDYVQNQSFERSDEILAKIFQYLAVAGDRRRFKTNIDQSIFDENDRIVLTAEFYNASYELTNEADVELKLTNANGEQSDFAFSKTEDAYMLDLGKLAPGDYNFAASLQDGGKRYRSSGQFTVRSLLAELQHIRADHQLLKNLSEESNGRFYAMTQLQDLKEQLLSSKLIKPLYISDYNRASVLNLNWLLGLLLLLLGLEWFLRKFFGSY